MAKRLTLKYAGECVACGAELDAGTEAMWWSRGRVSCLGCDGTMTPEEYEARKQAKAERYQQYADNARARSQQAEAKADQIAGFIPFGQPILVGHHSERKHRRDIERIGRNINAAVEEGKKADYWERRAKNATSERVIHSDDPAAADKLRAKIAALEAQRDRIKEINKIIRKAAGKSRDREALGPIIAEHPDLTDAERTDLLGYLRFSYGAVGYPTFVLTNLGNNIKRLQGRLIVLERGA